MKSVLTILFTLSMTLGLKANVITAAGNGDWSDPATWNPVRVPAGNDTIIIPVGITVTFTDDISLSKVRLKVFGVLDLVSNAKLRLDALSVVVIESGGRLKGNGANDQLRIDNTTIFKGNDPDVVGYAYADDTTGGFITGTLPVVYETFYVTRQGTNNQLSWSTSKELNTTSYTIEKSTDSRNWKQIATLAGAGTSSLLNKYGYSDKSSTDAVVYYRIRQVDMNGTAVYSAIRSLRNNEPGSVTNIFASSNNTVIIDFNSDVKDNVSIQLINMGGQVIARKEFSRASYRLVLNTTGAGSGVYVVRVSDSKGWSEVKKIML
ncbi:MAG TPA: T9SS type A sorting domain-containing protein [Niastella sp.]